MPYAVITTTSIDSGKRVEVVLNDLAPALKFKEISFYSDDIIDVGLNDSETGIYVSLKNGTKYILTKEVETSGTIKVDSIDGVEMTSNQLIYDTVKAFR